MSFGQGIHLDIEGVPSVEGAVVAVSIRSILVAIHMSKGPCHRTELDSGPDFFNNVEMGLRGSGVGHIVSGFVNRGDVVTSNLNLAVSELIMG